MIGSVSAITASATQRARTASHKPSRLLSASAASAHFWMSCGTSVRPSVRLPEWGKTPASANTLKCPLLRLGKSAHAMGREAGVYFKWGEIRPAGIYRRSRPQVLRLGFEGRRRPGVPGRRNCPGLFERHERHGRTGHHGRRQDPVPALGLNQRDQIRIGAERPGAGLDGGGFGFAWQGASAEALYVVGVPLLLRSWATAVTSCDGANGLVKRTLLGTPREAHWAACA